MTLLMRDQENVEKGREMEREENICVTVSSLRDFAIPDNAILQKIQEKYNLSLIEAERYMAKSET